MDSKITITEPPASGTEVEVLLGILDRVRGYVGWKCGGLDAAGLNARHEPSTMTLGGLLKHLALVEDDMFSVKLWGNPYRAPWDAVDWDADPNWEWRTAADDSPEQLMGLWRDSVERSRALVAEALADGGLDHQSHYAWSDGHHSLRRMIADMIEEYARHVGHADLIRESVDGLVGEDPSD
jgi:hypothetical protein